MKDNITGYTEYVDKWLSGIEDEIEFWDNYMRTEGGVSFYGFNETISPQKKFTLENDIPENLCGKEIKFIDVGSGPFSRCGLVSEKAKLKATYVDPLAEVYEYLKRANEIDNGITVETCFVELLDKKYTANSFDIVHMSNSLDHCFSAIDGIYQLLYICKVGGKVILRHHENEAENEHYRGLHQWNLSLNNNEKTFLIWRKDIKIDVCKLLEDYVDFELYPNQRENNGYWVFNKVVMKKKREINIGKNNYSEELLFRIYHYFIKIMIEKQKNGKDNTYELQMNPLIASIRDTYHSCANKKIKTSIKNAAVYGMGYVGRNVCFLLESIGIEVPIKMDTRGVGCGCIYARPMEEVDDFEDIDIAVVTAGGEDVYKKLIEKGFKKVTLIEDFLQYLNEL
ncbi:hypothetical protein [Pseudobutyrivibrio xylanivorans]|uniref:Class I SAM-dependent methyltransferase n=1 Tax=Pseudobutyrivibrio xylanivorans TaxID=185007 RepID=A0A5P6VQN6_PSEXY|nr:hypothetical protein [Pseudobutyrivibrio xylanivorans]QFJ54995.1 class I SAM-dependent methyltransferase [Pseudobutyrivibrio xylanivorans]